MRIEFRDAYPAWQEFHELVTGLIVQHSYREIAEIGAGANPLLPVEFCTTHELSYQLIDYSPEELDKAGPSYKKWVVDFQRPFIAPQNKADLVIAQMTLEHIRQPDIFFENIRRILKPGGRACLFFASVTNLPMLMNHLLPDNLSHRILLRLQPFRKNEKHGKFPAFYRWCYGPTPRNIDRINNTGLAIELYRGYFGHSYYEKVPLLARFEKFKTRFLLKHPTPHLCTYGQLVLRSDDY